MPDKNSVFNSEGDSDKGGSSSYDLKNFVAFNVSMLIRQIASVEYSRRLGDVIVLQGGAGLCFGMDYIAMIGNQVDWVTSSHSSGDAMSLSDAAGYGTIMPNKSPFLTGSIRFITDDDYDWGSYLEINSRFYSNKLQIDKMGYDSRDIFNGNPTLTIKNHLYSLISGVTYVTDGNIKTSHDLFCGFGFRVASYNTYKTVRMEDPQYGYYNVYQDEPTIQKLFAPSILFGYKFGFGF